MRAGDLARWSGGRRAGESAFQLFTGKVNCSALAFLCSSGRETSAHQTRRLSPEARACSRLRFAFEENNDNGQKSPGDASSSSPSYFPPRTRRRFFALSRGALLPPHPLSPDSLLLLRLRLLPLSSSLARARTHIAHLFLLFVAYVPPPQPPSPRQLP